MFEFDQYGEERDGERTAPSNKYEPFASTSERAILQWGEHCVECAAPDCYTTCDLYVQRPDGRCRRFQYGIHKNKNYSSGSGFGAEIIFNRWSKLEARANSHMFSKRGSEYIEALLSVLTIFGNIFGKILFKLTGDIRWSYLSFALRERFNKFLHKIRKNKTPEALVIEVYNPGKHGAVMNLQIFIDKASIKMPVRNDQLPAPFMKIMEFSPGYNIFEILVDEFREIVNSDFQFGIALIPEAETGTHLVFLTLDLVRYSEVEKHFKKEEAHVKTELPPAKCVVFDLDNTLWDGVLLEGEVNLKNGIREIFSELDERGILLSIASKNNYEDAWNQLEAIGISEYFLYPQIGWGQKSKGIEKIKSDIDIGINTFLFVDDNPFEREEVSTTLPQVEVLPETSLEQLLEHPRLQGAKTAESKNRRRMYKEAEARDREKITFDGDYLEFLKACELKLEIFPVDSAVETRISELVQRTNQLNFSGRKYTREEFSEILQDNAINKTALSCRDKYGDYGVIGACIWVANDGNVRIQDLMLSCRVQGKFIEQALFYYLIDNFVKEEGEVSINFIKTERNSLAQAVLDKIGFQTDAGDKLIYKAGWKSLETDFIKVEAR